ncbi:MAG: PD-(D/E)XK nuclease family protein [Verrucomicrobiota bacterium JB022]|nr:PD-(D/E)XK nuclease family protein [Verrucomicrobiota bacterium JB022]
METSTAFYAAHHADDLWPVVEAWCRLYRLSLAPPKRPDVVVAPSRALSAALKTRLLDAGVGTVGLQFWTPSDLRRHLVRARYEGRKLATREDLQLLAALARPELPADAVEGIPPSPDAWLTAWDELASAGWGAEAFSIPFAQQWTERFEKLLDKIGLLTTPKAEVAFAEERPAEPRLGRVLLVGFGPGHHRWQTLLRGAVRQAQDVTFVFPRPAETTWGQVWWSLWESLAGEPSVIETGEARTSPLTPLVEALETSGRLTTTVPLELNVARSLSQEADLVARQVVAALAEPEAERIGVLLPNTQGLARLVAQRLQDLQIPHHDTFGFFAAASAEQRLFNHWVAWQQDRRVDDAYAFFRLLADLGKFDPVVLKRAHRGWENAIEALISDDFAVTLEWLRLRGNDQTLLDALDGWALLENQATWARYVELSTAALQQLGWAQGLEKLSTACEELRQLEEPCPRDTFLRWLAETLRTPGRQRQALGRDAFARVQLLDYREAGGQVFSHVILAGLSDGQWPPQEREAAFLTDADRQRLNQEVVSMGRAGEGQLALLGDRGYLPTFGERRVLAREGLLEVLRHTTVSAYASCTVHRDREVGEPLQPGELFWELVYAQEGRLWEDAEVNRQQGTTARRWLEPLLGHGPEPVVELAPVAATQAAQVARLRMDTPFGEWDGGFARPPQEPLVLSARDWEKVLSAPAQVWMQSVLGLEAKGHYRERADEGLARGIWVHRWLEQGVDAAKDAPDFSAQLPERVRTLAEQERVFVEQAWQKVHRPRPELWPSVWQEALRIAAYCAGLVASIGGDWRARPEFRLPDGSAAVLAGHRLQITGKVDLILERQSASGPEYWIVDYKTGNRAALKARQAVQGDSLQLLLYALAMPPAVGPTRVSLLSEQVSDVVQIHTGELEDLAPVLETLAAIQRTGTFGFTGPVRARWGFAEPYPFALLPLPPWVVQAKWTLTHPNLACPA